MSVHENLLPTPLKQVFLDGVVNNCLTNFKIKNKKNKNMLALADITNIHNLVLDVRAQNSVDYHNNMNN